MAVVAGLTEPRHAASAAVPTINMRVVRWSTNTSIWKFAHQDRRSV
jgi:hypothetical protein